VEDPETIEEVLGRGTANVISEIERFRRILADSSADRVKRAEALKFIIHFVGDLHQPLHVGRLGDRGGNGTHVTWFRKSSNLHTVWDTELVDFISLSYSELARWLTPPSYSQLIEWQSGTVRDWAQESFDLRGKVYDIGSGNLSFEYADRSVPIVRQRLLQAGVRLAGLLNSIFY
jgi:hypothetical protein